MRITAAHDRTSSTLDDSASLMRQRVDVASKQQLLETFRKHFVFSDDEVLTLTSTAEPVDERFFAALSKAKRISKDCEILLGFERQTLGLDIMEQTSKNINTAFQKLHKWVQKEFRTLNLENPQLNPSIRRAIRVLAERPSLFQSCLDFFADARQRILADSFHVALTGTSTPWQPGHSVKPIEMAAHDPLRYVGDMLAWIHSATVSEREALEVLFLSDGDEIAKGLQSGRAHEIWQYMEENEEDVGDGPSTEFDALKALNELVDRDITTAARALRHRVEQVVQSNEETILAYRLANLVGFYRVTFAKLLGDVTGLVSSMYSLEAEALRQFRSLVRDHIAALQGEFQQTPSDLGPPEFFLDALKQLRAILQTYETSLSSSTDREGDFQPILAEAFEPFIAGSESMGRSMERFDRAIFNINCLVAALNTLKPFDFVQKRAQDLQGRVQREADEVFASQYRFFREGSGLGDILDAVGMVSHGANDLEALKQTTALQPQALGQASQALDDFLPSALMDAVDKVKHIQDSKLAREITEKAAETFCNEFEKAEETIIAADGLEEVVSEEGQNKMPLRALLPRTAGEIRVLLS